MDDIQLKQLTNIKDKKSLGYRLVFLHEQWLREQHSEDFNDYVTYVKNTYKKYTPKKTKFIEFKHFINNNYRYPLLSLTLQFKDCEHLHTFITDGKKVNYYNY